MADYFKVTNPRNGLSKYVLAWELSKEDEEKLISVYEKAGYEVESILLYDEEKDYERIN